jgi:hypothetical protein
VDEFFIDFFCILPPSLFCDCKVLFCFPICNSLCTCSYPDNFFKICCFLFVKDRYKA